MKKSLLLISAISIALLSSACTAHKNNTNNVNSDKLSPGIPLPAPATGTGQPVTPLQPKPVLRTVKEDIYTADYDPNPEVVRYDRYTLVTSTPDGGQKYLLDQMVNVNMTGKRNVYQNLSVQQGLRNTLRETGYSLCYPDEPDVKSLFNLPLPKVHYKFGPTKLRDALQMLAGEAYVLTVNDATRQVCFTRRVVIPGMTQPKARIEAGSGDVKREYDGRNDRGY
ncbi:PilL N-terminal domain-containing protein [Pasteurellaceae bacterium LIM206]|nr:PilL N-terminal domain-containing protein [Pasteurellaceae bacterium LIM206]